MAKVLVVEDSATDRDYLRDLLQKAGHSVLVAASGHEAVDMARRDPPDLVFMDIVMEDGDGYHAMRSLREDPKTTHVPVVVVSSKNQKADKMWAQLQGAKGYVVKPASAEAILAHIDSLLSRRSHP
ncbi:response regulator [Thermochromatium tepidum]|jgi:Response regulator containing a CheY-like receiver domain and a GGDEF domain|uniref:Response regulator n=1 Tax=Thermochromatium tepidum ATCC 43061 TaxID=316276 RepID=A0A6I6EA17_THETI|nr:response regulator [Thermochromatium tepidum]QGU31779.1 response regulator [Thermochromatium tepidum ATCC 43061]